MKAPIIAIVFAVLAVISAGIFTYFQNTKATEFSDTKKEDDSGLLVFTREDENVSLPLKNKTSDEIKLVFVGDIMLSRGIGRLMEEKDDWSLQFEFVKNYLKSADLTFGNLEGPISSKGRDLGSIYSFRADPRAVEGLNASGFDVLSFANNHVWDYGKDAFLDTFKVLSYAGIDYVGAGENFTEAHRPVIKEVKGTEIAYLAYTNLLPASLLSNNSSPAVASPDREQVKLDLEEATRLADITVVSIHWGDEYKTSHNTYQESLGHFFIDNGADLVIGHHPHVMEEMEEYKNGYIAYSLGNFIFDQNFSPETGRGLVLEVLLESKAIKQVNQHMVSFNELYQPKMSGVN